MRPADRRGLEEARDAVWGSEVPVDEQLVGVVVGSGWVTLLEEVGLGEEPCRQQALLEQIA